MGYHYVNADNVGSTDPAKPAALLYENGPYGGSGASPRTPRPSYALHAWIYKQNPSGLFNPMHPAVTCPATPAP